MLNLCQFCVWLCVSLAFLFSFYFFETYERGSPSYLLFFIFPLFFFFSHFVFLLFFCLVFTCCYTKCSVAPFDSRCRFRAFLCMRGMRHWVHHSPRGSAAASLIASWSCVAAPSQQTKRYVVCCRRRTAYICFSYYEFRHIASIRYSNG